jgi:pentatricopeptide repeat protein
MKKLRALAQTLSFSQFETLISQKDYPQALKCSLTLSSPLLTDQTYSLFIKSGHFLDPYVSTALISHFSKLDNNNNNNNNNNLSRSLSFFLDTQNPDIITYNAIISGFARANDSRTVLGLFNELRHVGLVPDMFTLSSLIKGCVSLRENWVSQGVCLKLGFGSKSFVISGLIDNYSKNGDLGSAERCFKECLDLDNVVCTVMVNGYVWNEEFEKGKQVFVEMRGLGLELNAFSLTGVVGALFDVREGEQIHGFGVKMGFLRGSSMHFSNAVMSMYARCGREVDAIKVFDEIAEPDVVSWTERIGTASDGHEAVELFRIVLSLGLDVNGYTLINVLSMIGGVKFLNAGKQIQALCHKTGYFQVVSVGNALVSMYGKCGKICDACRVFYNMIIRDSVSWNSLISACSENGFVNQALDVFYQMRELSLQPTIHTLASILEAVSNSNNTKQVIQIHSLVVKCGFMFDVSMICCLITAYGRCNSMDESKRVFAEIDKVNLVHLNTMITTFVRAGYYTDALALYQTIWSLHRKVDSRTFSIILKACSAITDMQLGRAVHSLVLKTGFDQDSFVESSVIDIYCKCGSIGQAEKAFRSSSMNSLAAWNAMMMGYAHHGCYQEVFDLFNKMSQFGIEPDEITYLGVLSSCCHGGLVKEARHYLDSMFELHGIIPHLEHYACMIDLLGRVGLLEDAKKTIDHMPIQPDVHIWQILLSACNIHGHVELGRVAARKLLEIHPENESAYILLSNIYASVGMWNAVGRLRKEMKEKNLRKEPGSSWIQVGRKSHTFFVNDTSHPQSKEIYAELIRLYKQVIVSLEPEQDGAFLWINGP